MRITQPNGLSPEEGLLLITTIGILCAAVGCGLVSTRFWQYGFILTVYGASLLALPLTCLVISLATDDTGITRTIVLIILIIISGMVG